jgi:ABC-type transport system involved in multi-copper enzyme maturation permease subunit
VSPLVAVTLNGFREARRNRITMVVIFFALAMIFSSTLAMDLTIFTFTRVMTDVGLGVMGLIANFLAIFLGTGQLPREIERRTIYMVASRPLSRGTFLLGRFLGNLLTVYFVIAAMTLLFVLQLFVFYESFTQPQLAALIGLCCEVALVSAIGFAFASVSSQVVSSLATTGLYFIGHLMPDLRQMSERSPSSAVRLLARVGTVVLPDFDRLNLKQRATYAITTSATELAQVLMYTLGYTAIVLVVAGWLFERRDFR